MPVTTVGSFGGVSESIAFGDNDVLGLGTGSIARFSYDTTDANANELLLQLPAGGVTDVPVLVIGQSIETVDLGLHNGVVDPRVCMIGVGAVTTGPGIDFRKARGTAAAPTVVTSGDDVGTIRGYACVAAGEWVQTAEVRFDCAGTIATTRGPGTITFLTATDAAPSVLTTALSLSAAQAANFPVGPLNIGTAGGTTGALTLTGTTSGVVTVKVADAAGTWTAQLPATAGNNGEQLTTNGGTPAALTWAAAASLGEFKELLAEVSDRAQQTLDRLCGVGVYQFRYKPDAAISTRDFDTVYTGVLAEDLPEVMHHDGKIFAPVSAFGELLLCIKALAFRVQQLEAGKLPV